MVLAKVVSLDETDRPLELREMPKPVPVRVKYLFRLIPAFVIRNLRPGNLSECASHTWTPSSRFGDGNG